jgi:hypothetical protein
LISVGFLKAVTFQRQRTATGDNGQSKRLPPTRFRIALPAVNTGST